jgi:CBS domain-containing protein
MLNERDIVSHQDEIGMTEMVGSVMSRHLQLVHPEADIVELAERMQVEKVDGMPVVETGRLLGVITTTDLLAHLVRTHNSPSASEITAKQIMTSDPEVGRLDDLFLDAAARMTHRGVRHLPIIDADRRVIGILSDRDVRAAMGNLFSTEDEQKEFSIRMEYMRVRDMATRDPLTVRETAPVSQIVRVLVDQRVGAVPVVDDDERLVGIVSYIDVLARPPGASRPLH